MVNAELVVANNVVFTYNDKVRMGTIVQAEVAKDYIKVDLVEGVVKTFKISQMKDLICDPPCDIKLFP